MASGERPKFHREEAPTRLIDGLLIYFIPYDPDPKNFMIPNDALVYFLRKGQTNEVKGTADKPAPGAIRHVSPGEYYVFLSRIALTQDQRDRIQGKPQYCRRITVKSRTEKAGLQEIPLFDFSVITSIQKLALGRDLSSVDPITTLLKIYVPTETGGSLVITANTSVSGMSLHYFDGKDEDAEQVTVRSGAGGGGVANASNANSLSYQVPMEKVGWYYVRVEHSGPVNIANTLTCDVIAKDGGTDWVPPNFWYFPFNPQATITDPVTQLEVHAPHATDPDGPCARFDSKFVTDSLSWEKGPTLSTSKGHTVTGVSGSDGHCADAALASIMFDIGVIPSGFAQQDLMLYAAEYCRRTCKTKALWSEKTGGTVGVFHQRIVDCLVRDKEPMLMDLRDSSGAHPDQIWNHAVYRASVKFKQAQPAGSELDIEISTELRANMDKENITGDPETGASRITRLEYQVTFGAIGKTGAGNSDKWLKVVNIGKKGETVIDAPRYIHKFGNFLPKPDDGGVHQVIGVRLTGNPYMTLKRILQLGLQLRRKFASAPYWPDPDGKGV